MSSQLSTLLLAAALAAGTTACATDAGDPPPTSASGVIASIDTKDGRVLFIADDDGAVGVGEVSGAAAGPAEQLIERDHATPLEVFLALAPPELATPEALTLDHAHRDGAEAPRALALPLADAVESSFFSCTAAAWTPWHNGATAGYDARSSSFYTTSGEIAFTGYINDQTFRRFDACAGSNVYDSFHVYVDRKTNAAAAYTNLVDVTLTGYQHFYYTSSYGSYPDWRMRVAKPPSGGPRSYGVAGAWTSLGLGG